MPKFICTYAYDVPVYRDFIVEAESEKQAQEIAEQALKDGTILSRHRHPITR